MSVDVHAAFDAGQTLAVADRILISPQAGSLQSRVDELLDAITNSGASGDLICRTLVQLGMNFVGRDAEIVGYGADEIDAALDNVLGALDNLEGDHATGVVNGFLADMKSVNLADSLSGLLAERIESNLDAGNPARSFLELLKANMRGGVYWQMIGENVCKFGNDFARGLEYLRHYGFCQVSTNPVLAAKAFDEDPSLDDELKSEIARHEEWKADPEKYADDIVMAATLIALWPNLSIFRPLAMHTGLKDYMVSFQLNPNIADQADASIEDARNAYRIADDYLKGYDKLLGVSNITLDPNIVFKVGGGHEAARKITTVLNSEGIGTNNTVVYTVAQEVQLVIDAFEGKARAAQASKQVVRTYETNMGGRFVSHLREVEAEKLFGALSEDRASELLAELASDLEVDIPEGTLVEQSTEICSYAHLKSLDHPVILKVAEAAGQSSEAIVQLEADLKKAGTVIARRVHWIFYAPENRPKWVAYLSDTYGLSEDQAQWILASMDVLPASKRVPDDTLHALGENMCHTEFPNHQRAVQLVSEEPDFDLDELRGSIGHEYEPGVAQRLYELPDFQKGYDLTPSLRDFLENEVQIDLSGWQTRGMEPGDWPEFGSVQKTTTEFKAAYDAFLVRCVDLAKEVAG
jgi:transaldolase